MTDRCAAVSVGLQLPTVDGFGSGYADLRPLVAGAEDVGFDSVWVGDHLRPNAPIVESIVAAATVAAVSKRIRIGFSVILPALRQPVWLAKQLSSLQVVSDNRIELGVGIGGEVPLEWELAGVPRNERVRRTDTILAALPALLTGETAKLADPWNLEVPPLLPAGSMPRVWVGGRSDAALRRAARFGDGWLALWADEDRLTSSRATMTRFAEQYGRPVPEMAVAVLVHPTQDVDTGERMTAEFMETIYKIPFQQLSKWVLVGEKPRLVDRLASLVRAGASSIILIPAVRDCSEHIAELGSIAAGVREQFANG